MVWAAGRQPRGGVAVLVPWHSPGGHTQSAGASRTVRSFASPSPSFCLEGEGKQPFREYITAKHGLCTHGNVQTIQPLPREG